MDAFTLTTGVIGIVSFILQMFDFFPKLGKVRTIVGLLLVGVCLGSFIRAIEPASIKFNVEVTRGTIVLAVFAAVILSFLVLAATTHDDTRRGEYFGVSGAGTLLFMIILTGSAMGSSSDGRELASAERERLTIQELRLLVDHATGAKDVERAVRHLRTLQTRLEDDEARKNVDDRIRVLERQALN